MEIFFVNTDAKSNRKHSYHAAWMTRGIAVMSGELTPTRDLSKIAQGDLVGMYVNEVGIVALGVPLDSRIVEISGPGHTVSPTEPIERHRSMDWLVDLRAAPLSIQELRSLGVTITAPPVRRVVTGKERLAARLKQLLAEPSSDEALRGRRAAVLQRMDSTRRAATA